MPNLGAGTFSVWPCALLSWALALPAHAQGLQNWFTASSCRAPISQADARALFDALKPGPPAHRTPGAAENEGSCVLLLSLGGPDAGANTTIGRAGDLESAARQAMALQPQFLQESAPWRRMDLIDQVADIATPPGKHSLGLWGIATAGPTPIALPGDVVSVFELLDEGEPGDLAIFGYLRGYYFGDQPSPYSGKRFDEVELPKWAFRFTTQAWFSQGEQPLLLYRGHLSRVSTDRASLLDAARRGGDYALRSMKENGRFSYLYMPDKDRERGGYNILRHAGMAYSLTQLFQATDNAAYLEGAGKALDYLRSQLQPCPGRAEALCVVEDGEIKLGGNGLGLLAASEYVRATGDEAWLAVSRKLADWIVASIQKDGAFRAHKWTFPGGEPTDYISGYYPGEAILGLVRLYGHDANPKWIEGARSATHYLVNVRDAGLKVSELPYDNWLLYALADLYEVDPDPLYVAHSKKLRQAVQEEQHTLDPQFPDWLGGHLTPPRATFTASTGEGLLGAWRLARAAGDSSDLDDIRRSACLGATFQLKNQFTPESAMFLPDPARVLGSFRSGLTNHEVRIDYVQHNISALLGVVEMLSQSETACEGN